MLVRMTHPVAGERLVPDRAVERYKDQGWEVKQPETEPVEASESSEAFSFPEHTESEE